MCIAAVRIITPHGAQMVSCRECWQCRQQKIDDYIGRNIAESKTAKKTHAFTLTYGTDDAGSADHVRARILTYSDVQKFIKRLRAAGYPCRYFVVGEYGDERGRAHWHGLIYWLDKVPPVPIRKKKTHSIEQWEHGYSFFDEPSLAAIRYACKYISKDMHVGGRQGVVHYSRMPPLGSEYFKQVARQYAKEGKAPNTLDYSFPGIERRIRGKRERERIKFRMRGKSAEIFVDEFLAEWERLHGSPWNYNNTGSPVSDAVSARLDKQNRPEVQAHLDGIYFKAYDAADPKNQRKNRAIQFKLLMDELIAESKWAEYFGEEAPTLERNAEDNWLKINVLGKKNGKT